jgi:hypothetical protein
VICTHPTLVIFRIRLGRNKRKLILEAKLIRLRAVILVTAFFTLTASTWAQGKALELSQIIPLPDLHDDAFLLSDGA